MSKNAIAFTACSLSINLPGIPVRKIKPMARTIQLINTVFGSKVHHPKDEPMTTALLGNRRNHETSDVRKSP